LHIREDDQMRRTTEPLALVVALLMTITPTAAQSDLTERTDAARAAAVDFGMTLIGELQQAIAAGGPANAIGVCHVAAPRIAAGKSAAMRMTIGRTSLKLRQPDNKPDAWEMQQLLRFEERKAAGESPATIEFAEYVETGGQRVFRYMKAIPTTQLCLACHGAALAPEVAARLRELYPQDAATGFKVGDLRGAFTIRQAPCGSMPAARTTLPHFALSAAIKMRNSSGVPHRASIPILRKRSAVSGVLRSATSAALIVCTMPFGVPARASSPRHPNAS
jgi:Protein of unknown function (DUF3365)